MDPDYELFAEVVVSGSLSAAGRRLRISPAMVSKRLARLERRLATQLVHRTTRRLVLTDAGQVFHADVLAILAAIRAAEARIAGQEGALAGGLRVTAPTSFGRLHIAPYLLTFLEQHPKVDLELDLSDGFVDLLTEKIDVAIRIAPTIEASLVAHRLGTSRRVLCAAPSYLAERGAPTRLADLARHHLLAATGQLPWRLDGPDGPALLAGESRVRTNSSEVVRELALAGAGIALRSLWDVSRDIAAGRLDRILPAYEGSVDVGIYAVHPRGPLVPASVSAFVGHLRALYSPAAPWDEGLVSASFQRRCTEILTLRTEGWSGQVRP
ncbi:LysR family transcriptional regulator [Chelatococcus reniformis]|uniref:Transcriptional regulator n=1 Tax=Chelatococcus reniformis TaxID=1494448 RepID=A0A916U5J7_9HYPH|nr:LysR family transcriptional regulator [Chelatococcus reniformis]GGC59901.1 transcriptional regulator [Chelatococcus reniformis]